MSKTFAERFKGRIEEFPKDGINRIIATGGQAVNVARQVHSDNVMYKDSQRLSRNAQNNILDFQKNYQTVLRPNSILPVSSDPADGSQGYNRAVYSAFDAQRGGFYTNPYPRFGVGPAEQLPPDIRTAPIPSNMHQRQRLEYQQEYVI